MTTLRRTAALFAAFATLALLPSCGAKKTYVVPSPSMEPNFHKGERFTVSGVPDRLEVGMVVLFKDPGGWLPEGTVNGKLLKRVIGVGGDHVVCTTADEVEVNGKVLDEPYLAKGTHHCDMGGGFDVRVPQGHLWLMGDNRDDSYDSRGHMGDPGGGYVPVKNVIGVVEEK